MKTSENSHQESKLTNRDRRLRLDHLSPQVRSYTIQALGVSLLACLLIILSGLGWYPFETPIEFPENLSPIHNSLAVPFSLLLILPVGLGLVAGALFYASYQPGWRFRLLTRLTIGIIALAFPLSFLHYSLFVLGATGIWLGLAGALLVFLSIGCGTATLICAFISTARFVRWAALFAMGSFLGISLAFLLFKLWWVSLARQNLINADTISVINVPLYTIISFLTPFVGLVGVIFFWKAIVEVKIFSREIGSKFANLGDRFPWLLAALFVLKITWLVIGYWGVLRGTAVKPWIGSGQDGPFAWLLAALFAITAVWWLTHNRKPVDPDSFNNTKIFITAGFLLLFIAAFLVFIPATIITSLGLERIGFMLGSISVTLADFGLSWTILFVLLLLPLGLVFLRWQRFRYLSPLFIFIGLWSLPSVTQQLIPGSNLSFEYLTFDTMLTITLLVLAFGVWRKKQNKDYLWIITLILVVSTLTALAESLIPEKYADLGLALLLVLPIVYNLFFDSAELNLAGAARGQRLIRALGFQAGLMLVVAWAFSLGLITADQVEFENVANKIFLPPILGLYLAGEISNRMNLQLAVPKESHRVLTARLPTRHRRSSHEQAKPSHPSTGKSIHPHQEP